MDHRVPADGDVVIEPHGPVRADRHALRLTSGRPQFTCRSLAEATRIATAFAANAHVNVWVRERSGVTTMVACFRDATADGIPIRPGVSAP